MNDVGATDPMVALAQLMLNADELRAQSDEDALRTARRDQQLALRDEVRALREAADDVRVGAWVEGLAAGAGGGASALAHAITPLEEKPAGWGAVLLESGHALGAMAGPAGREFGEAPRMDAQADAKQHEQESADAGTRAELASRHSERMRDDQERLVATLGDVLESEAQGNLAIIANV